MKEVMKKYYNHDSTLNKLNKVLLEYVNLPLKDFTYDQWEALEQAI